MSAPRYMVVVLPGQDLTATIAGPFRSIEKAESVAQSLDRTADLLEYGSVAVVQVVQIETVSQVRGHIKEGSM